ncbi:unnamed protein product [Calicophoron daubneyi]|uniref:Uncharacterized protein n=1 Tax=Calicophoron daubneyi TaxID=300641 RepID=A0AAV2T2L1_CALDB
MPFAADCSHLSGPAQRTTASEQHATDVRSAMNDREQYQQKVYYYLTELRQLLAQAPQDIQSSISDEVLTQIAHCLADGNVFDVVADLAESQRLEEQAMHKQLIELRSEQSAERAALRKRNREARSLVASRPHHLPILEKEQEQERQHLNKRQANAFRSMTSHIVHAMDGRVIEQQTALEQAGLPMFFATTNPQLIRVQMRMLDWIMRLARRPLPAEICGSVVPIWPP